MRASVRKISILQLIVIMIFDHISINILREGPESIQMNFITKPRCQGIHQKAGAWSLDLYFVCKPVPGKGKIN